MTDQDTRPAPEVHVTDIVLPNQTKNENQFNGISYPAHLDFVK